MKLFVLAFFIELHLQDIKPIFHAKLVMYKF